MFVMSVNSVNLLNKALFNRLTLLTLITNTLPPLYRQINREDRLVVCVEEK